MKGVQNGILNGKREKNQKKMKRKSLYSPLFKRDKRKKVSKNKLIIKFQYIFLTNSLVFNFFLLISCRFPILNKGKLKEKCRI